MANLQLNLKVKNMDEFRSKVDQMEKLAKEIEDFQFEVEAEPVSGKRTTITPEERRVKGLEIELTDDMFKRRALGR